MNGFLDALGASSYLAHAICLTGDKSIIALYLIGDMAIFVSYLTIAWINTLTKGVLAGPGWMAFSAFIFMCGVSHLTKTLVLYLGIYRLDVVVVMLTAGVSVATALYVAWGYAKWRSIQPL